MMVGIIIVASLFLIVGGLIIFNLLKKLEKAEDIVVGYLIYLDKISRVIESTDVKLKEIDHKGSFEADDEIGFFFQNIKEIQSILNDFNIKNLSK